MRRIRLILARSESNRLIRSQEIAAPTVAKYETGFLDVWFKSEYADRFFSATEVSRRTPAHFVEGFPVLRLELRDSSEAKHKWESYTIRGSEQHERTSAAGAI